jgi:hypothetical protein
MARIRRRARAADVVGCSHRLRNLYSQLIDEQERHARFQIIQQLLQGRLLDLAASTS